MAVTVRGPVGRHVRSRVVGDTKTRLGAAPTLFLNMAGRTATHWVRGLRLEFVTKNPAKVCIDYYLAFYLIFEVIFMIITNAKDF